MWLDLFLQSLPALAPGLLVISFLRSKTLDGWAYPVNELRWLFGSAASFLCLSADLSAHPAAPLLAFCRDSSLAVFAWSLTTLMNEVRFSDRSALERGGFRQAHRKFEVHSRGTLLAALLLLLPPLRSNPGLPLSLLAIPLLLGASSALRTLEWKRIFKRSGLPPLLFQFTLFACAGALIAFPLLRLLAPEFAFSFLRGFCWALFLLGGLRLFHYHRVKKRGQHLARECREELFRLESGSARLLAFCDFVEDEWAAARVSVISVKEEMGLMVACAGPEAIPEERRSGARKLGPFLRRVCRAGHILYAPVAEELGKDLQDQGMRHSSLALPLLHGTQTRAVVCVMAEEGERIPPSEAMMMEILVRELALELLSAVAQHIAEDKCERLMAIARRADAIAVEHIDSWGHLRYEEKEESRILLGASVEDVTGTHGSTTLRKAEAEYRKELRTIWIALAASFEFILKETKDDFWVMSPREFHQPFLKALGPERAAQALALSMDRQSRALAGRQAYLLLGQPLVRIALGAVTLHLESRDERDSAGVLNVDRVHLEQLRRLRERANSSGPVFRTIRKEKIGCRGIPWATEEEGAVFTLTGLDFDRRDWKSLENRALERARSRLRKTA